MYFKPQPDTAVCSLLFNPEGMRRQVEGKAEISAETSAVVSPCL